MIKYNGYIEGYYGRMLSWGERVLTVNCMSELKLNAYLYAPKEDPFHRVQWKDPYPPEWLKKFGEFIAAAKAKGVTVIPTMAPGLSYDYLSKTDYKILFDKFANFQEIGATTVGLMMDDIPEELPTSCKKTFASLGEAHGKLIAQLLNDLRKKNPRFGMWFCPTVYCDDMAKGKAIWSSYLVDLSQAKPSEVTVLWTGSHVISETLNYKTMCGAAQLFDNNLIIWDNFYANDYCPQKLNIGPYSGRGHDVLDVVRGIMLNATGMGPTDRFLLALLANLLAGKTADSSWKAELKSHKVPDSISAVSHFFASPFSQISPGDLTIKSVNSARTALKELVWKWKSALQRDWYQYLFMLDTDLALWEKRRTGLECVWLHKKYSPVIAELMSGLVTVKAPEKKPEEKSPEGGDPNQEMPPDLSEQKTDPPKAKTGSVTAPEAPKEKKKPAEKKPLPAAAKKKS
jgi:hypothetical protein